jgi:DNA gyrase subunit A
LEDLQKEEKVAAILNLRSFEEKCDVLLVTLKGVIKKTELLEYSNPRRKGVNAIKLDEGDSLISARLVKENEEIMLFTRNGMAVRFDAGNVRTIGRVSRGVKGVTLKDSKDYLVACEIVVPEDTILTVCEKGYGKRSKVEDFRKTNRGGVGVRSILTSERNGLVVGAVSVNDGDGVLLMSSSGQTLRIRMSECRVMGRSTQGVRLVNLKEEDTLIGMQKIAAIMSDE